MSFRAVFFSVAAIIVVILVGGGAFLWYQAGNIHGLTLGLTVPGGVTTGVPFDLQVSVGNDSDNILKDAELTVELPDGFVFVGSPEEKNLIVKNLGTLGGGSVTQEPFSLLALRGEGSIKQIKATVSYFPANIGSRFEKVSTADLAVTAAGINLDFSIPGKVFAGEDFTIEVSYQNVSEADIHDLALTFTFPPAFNFKSATLKPDVGNNIWNLGDLRSKSEGKFTITGSLIGAEGSFFELKSDVAGRYDGRAYSIAEKSASLGIAASPLLLQIKLNNNDAYIVHTGDDLNYHLAFINNTDTALRDVVLQAKLTGALFDFTTLSSTASFRQSDHTLIWNGGNTPLLTLLAPGQTGAVDFHLRAKSDYPIRRLSDKNFTLRIEGQIESPTVPYNVSATKTIGLGQLETKVGGEIMAEAKGLFRDAASEILNKGPLPMKVGQTTNFTIHWVVTNYGTDVKDFEVRAVLSSNVRATGIMKSNIASAPTYNDRTGELVWQIPLVLAGRGIANTPIEAIIQVAATPAVNQAGSAMTLIGETSFTGTDDFTGETLNGKSDPVVTNNLADSTVDPSQGIVQP
jgi:hypothetical protein